MVVNSVSENEKRGRRDSNFTLLDDSCPAVKVGWRQRLTSSCSVRSRSTVRVVEVWVWRSSLSLSFAIGHGVCAFYGVEETETKLQIKNKYVVIFLHIHLCSTTNPWSPLYFNCDAAFGCLLLQWQLGVDKPLPGDKKIKLRNKVAIASSHIFMKQTANKERETSWDMCQVASDLADATDQDGL